MLTEDAKDLLVSLGKTISEVRFEKAPEIVLLNYLFEECSEVAISFNLRNKLPIADFGVHGWTASIVSAHLTSDGFSDWDEIQNFVNLRELVLTIVPYDPDTVDTRDVSDMQLALLNLPHLRSLVVDITGYHEQAISQIESCLHFPGSPIAFELKKTSRRLTKRSSR